MKFRLNIISLNIFTILLYGAAFFLDYKTNLSVFKNLIGLIYLFVVIPVTFLHPFSIKNYSIIERYFLMLVCFFSIYVPLYYFLNHSFSFPLSAQNIFLINLFIFIISIAISIFRSIPMENYSMPVPRFSELKKEWVFFSALLLYGGIHILNYHFYGFIPEWDSYGDLIRINHGLESGMVEVSYRGFFATATQILSLFSGLRPYFIFSVIYIALQSSILFAIRSLLDRYDIKKTPLIILIYTIALSIPVINMEIDMTRPQNIFVILFPVFLVFASRFLIDHKPSLAFFTFIIAISGINYHEFFIFPLFISLGWLSISFAKKIYWSQDKRDILIFALIILVSILSIISLSEKIIVIRETISFAEKIVIGISDTSSWRLWFLGNYESDGATLQMGWPGFSGAIKYYAYYLSPILSIALFVFGFMIFKKTPLSKDPLVRVSSPFIIIFLLFAEIFPRINYLYLPERFWMLIDIILILITIPILQFFTVKKYAKHLSVFLFVFCLIGIGGSIYVAKSKRSLTSKNEYRAALWIQKNTPEKSVFISQSANSPMIQFFAHRTMLPSIDSEYFLSENIIEQSPENEISKLKKSLEQDFGTVSELTKKFTENKISFFVFSDSIQERRSFIKQKNKEIHQWERAINQPKYIVYSYEKFDTLYKDREWWLASNFFGANIEKFNRTYPLVYQSGGVYIWKVR